MQPREVYRYETAASLPYDATFVTQGELIITSSDKGRILVFDRSSSKLVQSLTHDKGEINIVYIS